MGEGNCMININSLHFERQGHFKQSLFQLFLAVNTVCRTALRGGIFPALLNVYPPPLKFYHHWGFAWHITRAMFSPWNTQTFVLPPSLELNFKYNPGLHWVAASWTVQFSGFSCFYVQLVIVRIGWAANRSTCTLRLHTCSFRLV